MTDLHFRFVENSDSRDLLRWRNDPITRKYSFQREAVSQKDHSKWFKDSLKNPNRHIFIIEDEKREKVGQIRFDRSNSRAKIDIAVDQDSRSKGIGTRILVKACELYFNNFNVDTLTAKIKKKNIASIKAFSRSGFDLHKEFADYAEYRLRK